MLSMHGYVSPAFFRCDVLFGEVSTMVIVRMLHVREGNFSNR